MKSILVFILIWGASFAAHAQDGTSSTALALESGLDGRRELMISPGITYSEENGWLYGVSGSIAFPMTVRSQIELGGILLRQADDHGDRDASGIYAGPVFNFSEDYARAFFAGIGAGYSNIFPFINERDRDERLTYAFAQAGKRFALFGNESFSYKPRFVFYTRGGDESEFQLDALNFSFLF